MNANAIATGGSTAKQFDCGTLTLSSGIGTFNFNFAFNNIPIVVATTTAYGSTYVYSVSVTAISKTGATLKCNITDSATVWVVGNDVVKWIAIG